MTRKFNFEKGNIMRSVLKVIKEQVDNMFLIRRLSRYELISQNKNNYLGMAWEVINPLIQILIYWFVFGSIRQRAPIEMDNGIEIPFIFWMLGAFALWTFFYQSVIQGSKSIYTRLRMLSKMNFPMSVIPSVVITSQFTVHFFIMTIVIVILNLNGFYINIYYLQLVYYIIATIILLFALTLITSTISTIIRDFHMLLNATLRMFLYLSPILWPVATVIPNATVVQILKLNPLYYLIEGYRSALFGTEWYFINHWEYTIYFWVLVLILLLLGSVIHVKFRRHFIDYL